MNKRKLTVVGISIGILALAIIIFKLQNSGEKPAEKQQFFTAAKFVNAVDANYDDFQSKITAYGRLLPINKIEIFSEVNGIMLSTDKKFKVGNNYSKGEILVKVDDEESKLSIYSAKSSFMNLLTSALADLKADFPNDYSAWKSYLDNFKIEGNISDLPNVNDNKLKYFLSNKQIYSQYYSIKNNEVRLSKYNIYAPFDGTVILSAVEPGTFIRQGQKIGEFSSVGTYELELNVISADIQYVNIGDEVSISSSELEDVWSGKVIRIAKNIDQNTQTVKVYAQVTGTSLREGMYMKAEISGIVIKNVVKIPRKALLNNKYVFTIEDSTLDKYSVNLVKFTEYDAYIRGIDSSKIIVTDALANAEIGMLVKRIEK